ncbi:hypothetical protein VB638_01430 [Dolichospermum sp. UHCC 0684]|jgi:hypothetical protein|uniref:hypothetical protein n=1 Tax=unclassified Dolichospermum TaxID=2622029 RepID=UPI0014456ED8|nr:MULTISPECIES: hypothetical protein [unclassified Dolichospermum]MEA5528262.1 hypothetical protein [Dolichospermum sp. UHCC 0684]MTJ36459.1 hypothetical protein [Dolichospermum sp. UHCC 0260]
MTISPTPSASPATNQGQSTAQTTQEGIVSNEKIDARNRENIAFGVLIASIVAILLVSATAIFSTTDAKERSLVSQRVMDSTLPLYGTWVGTILAFYFSRNAFEAASSATDRNATVFQQVRSDLVSAAPPDNKLANISLKSLANGLVFSQDNLNNPLEDVLKDLNSKNRYRTIVVDKTTKNYVNLVYKVNVSAFLEQRQSGTTPQPTLQNYLDWRKEQGKQCQPIVVFLPETATLADAEAKMKETLGCRDVIVTTDGQKTSPVVAYVTDNEINEYK